MITESRADDGLDHRVRISQCGAAAAGPGGRRGIQVGVCQGVSLRLPVPRPVGAGENVTVTSHAAGPGCPRHRCGHVWQADSDSDRRSHLQPVTVLYD